MKTACTYTLLRHLHDDVRRCVLPKNAPLDEPTDSAS